MLGRYTPQDYRADLGLISPLPTILDNAPIILVDLKIILLDFPVVWGVLRVTESARKNVGGAQSRIINIQHVEYLRSEILLCLGGTPRTNLRLICRLSRETKQYPIRKRADRRRKHNKCSQGAAQKDSYHCHFFLPLPKTGILPLL